MYYAPPPRLYFLANGEGPLSPADVDDLLTAASALTRWHADHGSFGQQRAIVADVRRMVRRLDPGDPRVASFDAWLRERGVEPREVEPPAAEPSSPAPPAAPAAPAAPAEPVTPEQIASSVHALDLARTALAERTAEHEGAVVARADARAAALAADTEEAWATFAARERRVAQLDALIADARGSAELAEGQHAALLERVRVGEFAAAVTRSSDEALTAALSEAVRLRREIAVLEERVGQIAYSATVAQNTAASEAFTIGRALGMTDAEITRRMVRAELALEGATHRGPRAVMAMLAALAATPEHRAPAEGATTLESASC